MCTARTPGAGTVQKFVVMPPARVPTKHTRSAALTTRLALSREYVPTTPTESGWVPGMVSLPLADVATGIASASASATNAAPARDERTPPPATITGRCASSRARNATSRSVSSGAGRNGGTTANRGSMRASTLVSSMSSWPSLPWTCRCTGPGRPDTATRNAWRSRSATRSG